MKDSGNTPTSQPLDWKKAEDHLADISFWYGSFAGKPGYNPFIYMHNRVIPLAHRHENGERTEDLYKEILALEKIEPTVPSSK